MGNSNAWMQWSTSEHQLTDC